MTVLIIDLFSNEYYFHIIAFFVFFIAFKSFLSDDELDEIYDKDDKNGKDELDKLDDKDELDDLFDNHNNGVTITKPPTEEKPPSKYEDKYLDDIRGLEKCFNIDVELKQTFFLRYYNELLREYEFKCNEIKDYLSNNELLLTKYETILQHKLSANLGGHFVNDVCDKCVTINAKDSEYDSDEECDPDYLQELIDDLLLDTQQLNAKRDALTSQYTSEWMGQTANQLAYDCIYNEHFDKFVNNYVIENTPLGNVLMFYNNTKKGFEYYSDHSIPYKYLEVVARKYVKVFKCRCLYVNMEDELKRVSDNVKEIDNTTDVSKKRKAIFAKFKNYNKSAGGPGSGAQSFAAPKNNNISTKNNTHIGELLLKENSNHYIHSGKFYNFQFLKKVKREQIDRNYALKYSDFKKKQKSNN
jgi:hypothetical protein